MAYEGKIFDVATGWLEVLMASWRPTTNTDSSVTESRQIGCASNFLSVQILQIETELLK